ncbi:glucosamine-6-phosphate deaminase [Mucilaginibacter sp. OK098]|uniref:glucosamine-6-phosphate deaminase n=1 Tax=Mucilaginibacter sp. OK098 TaxID=1855297 RepID=UPI00090F9B29|nr:glucosamine-6-phosphate deaminase [Mucilaginibacter sp. OK098]SHM26781.1 glucosamine-6-phosphate deaminase [Mucilaginibacter sp. OK098]
MKDSRDAMHRVSNLQVLKYEDRVAMGKAAAGMVCQKINELFNKQQFVNMIFAAAPSQNEFLSALIQNKTIEWQRINAFHMDEYIGLYENDSRTFASFLKEKIFCKLSFHTVNYINGNATDPDAECKRYTELLNKYPTDIVCMGIGENGHIAFNDPHVAYFNDPVKVKVVSLDEECRQQQVNDKCFDLLDEVPIHAITLTVPALMAGKYIYCMVPGEKKAKAVYNTLNTEINEKCPATILRKHANALLFIDKDSGALL